MKKVKITTYKDAVTFTVDDGEEWDEPVRTAKPSKPPVLLLVILLIIFTCAFYSCNAAITDDFLTKIERIESGINPLAIGDNGKSIGSLQFKFEAWLDVSEYRASKRLKTYPYQMATNRQIARMYAKDYFTILELQLVAATGKKPSTKLLAACWNLGFTGLQRRDFSLKKLPITTRKYLAKL